MRPWVQYFLKQASKNYEIVVFTGSEKDYADKAINLLDPQKKFIKHRVYRNSCMYIRPLLIKDLNILGRDLSKTLIIDNCPNSFTFQVLNF